ncbi:MAG: hypothetical protein H7X93_04120, partial [Sphingomonadaceae bacterium]|nr:hypothetical protein [Sphingomonadaceae bacterium]
MGRTSAPLAILMPVGPDCDSGFVADTIASVRHYLGADTPFLVVDNSRRSLVAQAFAPDPALEILTIDHPQGRLGALWTILARGMKRLRERHDPEVLLRIDTDALVTGASLIAQARARFDAEPSLAVLGAYRVSATGGPRDFSTSADALRRAAARDDAIGQRMSRAIVRAETLGYEVGEHVLGGVCLYHRRALDALDADGLFDDVDLGACGVSEDVLFGLFLRAAGLSRGLSASPGQPLGANWRGLRGTPVALVEQRR